jgi:hypothetical protein
MGVSGVIGVSNPNDVSYWNYSFMMIGVSPVSVYSFMMAGVSPLSVYSVTSLSSLDFLRPLVFPDYKINIPSVIHSCFSDVAHTTTVLLPQSFSVPVLARTSPRRVGLRNASVFEFACSGEGQQSCFWEVSLATRLLASSSTSWMIAGDLHGFSSALHRAVRLHRQALCRLVHSALPMGMSS